MGNTVNAISAGAGPNERSVNVDQTQNPAWVNDASKGIWNAAVGVANTPYQTYDGPQVADFNHDQTSAMDNIRGAVGGYTPYINTALDMQKAGGQGWQGPIPTTAAMHVGDIAGKDMGVDNMSVKDMGPVAHVGAGQTSTGMWNQDAYNTYKNPWDKNVLDASTSEIQRQNQITNRNSGASAATAGAFGGARHGILEAENNRNDTKLLNDTISGINQKGYENAQGMFTTDQARALTSATGNVDRTLKADQGNQTMDFNVGKQNQDTQFATGKQNQDTAFNVGKQNQANNLAYGTQNQKTQVDVGTQNQKAGMFDTTNALDTFSKDQQRKIDAGTAYMGTTTGAHALATADNNALMNVGNAEMVKDQAGITARRDNFNAQRDDPQKKVDWLTGILPKLPKDTTSVSDTVTPTANAVGQTQTGSGVGQAIGAAATIASMFT